MAIPVYTVKTNNLRAYLRSLPKERFAGLVEGRAYVSGRDRRALNEILKKEFGIELSKQLRLDFNCKIQLKRYDPIRNEPCLESYAKACAEA